MSNSHVFISHSSKDDAFVRELRRALEALGINTWVDSRNLRGGSKLAPEIEEAIEGARQFVAVISANTVESPWVRREIRKALEVEGRRKGEGYRVIPLLLGLGPQALELWFDEEPVGVLVKIAGPGGLGAALPSLLAALGERLPDDPQRIAEVAPPPVEELVLRLGSLRFEEVDGVRRARGVAQLVYEPADETARNVESRPFMFTAPLGVIEAEELRWYLEEYVVWPVKIHRERAERTEARLPAWGQTLYREALGEASAAAQEPLNAWQRTSEDAERRFSVVVDEVLPVGTTEEEQARAREAAVDLLSLPWELLHDGRGFLFHGTRPVRVRRRLPNRYPQRVRQTRLPIRLLLVSPRPEDEHIAYLDHRICARPLVDAVEGLGDWACITVLTPPTFPALEEALRAAEASDEPYDVVHFDGRGVYDPKLGLGTLCFEDPNDIEKLKERAVQFVDARRLAEVIRDRRIPLIYLGAYQTAKIDANPTASVAARLLDEGVTSVVAMSHSVLIETARRFVGAFYKDLALGRRVGTAMLVGQQALYVDHYRGRLLGVGELRLQDWFVPVLYQEEQDPQLVTSLPAEEMRRVDARKRRMSLARLPAPPEHSFQGRSRELLTLERLLHTDAWAVIRGPGGEGKTLLAAELARWLVRTGRFERAAFVSLEHNTHASGVLDGLGRKLLPEGDDWSSARFPDMGQALQAVERVLTDYKTLIILDNLESVLPDAEGRLPPGVEPPDALLDLCRKLLEASPSARLVFTTRVRLPAPFDHDRREVALGALDAEDAMHLVSEVMKQGGFEPKADDPGSDPSEVTALVEAAGRQPRALVLLSREVAHSGVRVTTENLRTLMEQLDKDNPGDRENSLYASLELSLRRLAPETRERAKVLAAFHNGAHLSVLGMVLGAELDAVREFARQLIDVGLAEPMSDGHLRFDSALPSYLLRKMSEEEAEALRGRWAGAMAAMTAFLYQQRTQDAGLSARLTLLELPNLLALLRWSEGWATPEGVVELAGMVEQLLAELGRRQALAESIAVRERAAQRLGGWGHAQFLAARAEVDRLMARGEVRAAYAAAGRLLGRCREAGEGAYPEAAYDLGMAHFTLGRALKRSGAAEQALPTLAESRNLFEAQARDGNVAAANMTLTVLSDSAECLMLLGRYDEAAESFEEAIRRSKELGNHRGRVVASSGLGTVRLEQGRYPEALAAHEEARQTSEEMGEPRSVAISWHQIGRVHSEAGRFEQAERAYRQSLAITVQQQDLAGEADTLGELGNLYAATGRPEEAVRLFRQAADINVKLQNLRNEGLIRSNLANVLLSLRRYDDARRELQRAIECDEPYSHAAEPWKTWELLRRLEEAVGDEEAAAHAWRRAVESYLSYRRDGGYSATPAARFCAAAAAAIMSGDTVGLEQDISQPLGEDAEPWARALVPKLLAVLRGERDPALAEDPGLDYDDAAELILLLERLNAG